MTIIEQYLQFAIDNGFELDLGNKGVHINNAYVSPYTFTIISYNQIINYIVLFTSNTFIESITKGTKNVLLDKLSNKDMSGWDNIDKITFLQGVAIRDEKLEDFIINLLIGIEKN